MFINFDRREAEIGSNWNLMRRWLIIVTRVSRNSRGLHFVRFWERLMIRVDREREWRIHSPMNGLWRRKEWNLDHVALPWYSKTEDNSIIMSPAGRGSERTKRTGQSWDAITFVFRHMLAILAASIHPHCFKFYRKIQFDARTLHDLMPFVNQIELSATSVLMTSPIEKPDIDSTPNLNFVRTLRRMSSRGVFQPLSEFSHGEKRKRKQKMIHKEVYWVISVERMDRSHANVYGERMKSLECNSVEWRSFTTSHGLSDASAASLHEGLIDIEWTRFNIIFRVITRRRETPKQRKCCQHVLHIQLTTSARVMAKFREWKLGMLSP